jgi:hypothetical protein
VGDGVSCRTKSRLTSSPSHPRKRPSWSPVSITERGGRAARGTGVESALPLRPIPCLIPASCRSESSIPVWVA